MCKSLFTAIQGFQPDRSNTNDTDKHGIRPYGTYMGTYNYQRTETVSNAYITSVDINNCGNASGSLVKPVQFRYSVGSEVTREWTFSGGAAGPASAGTFNFGGGYKSTKKHMGIRTKVDGTTGPCGRVLLCLWQPMTTVKYLVWGEAWQKIPYRQNKQGGSLFQGKYSYREAGSLVNPVAVALKCNGGFDLDPTGGPPANPGVQGVEPSVGDGPINNENQDENPFNAF